MNYYLAFDIGTTNWKAAVFREDGTLVAIERTPTRTHRDEAGNSYYDPEELWGAVCGLSKTVTAKAGVPIAAVSVTSIAEAVVAVDSGGRILGDIITWFDTRSMAEAEMLKAKFGAQELYSITGLDVNPIFSLPKILWVRQHQPQLYARAAKWLQMADYILFCLTGECVTDYTLASRTLAFDVGRNQWSQKILDGVDLPLSSLPTVCESGTVIGTIGLSAARETGITPGAKVVVGGNDHPCASIAAGVIRGDKILDSSGTAESFLYISDRKAPPPLEFRGQRTCRYLQKDRYALWGGIICSGRSFDWAWENFAPESASPPGQKPHYDEVLDQVLTTRAMETGLLFYPHLRGAGAPYWEPKASGAFVGLRDTHTRLHLLRAVLEGLSMQARMIVEMEEALSGRSVDALCVVGGSARNLQWQTIKASVVQKPVELCREPEAAALGAAMLAAIGDGTYRDIEQVSDKLAAKNTVLMPDKTLAEHYKGFYELYKEGYEQMRAFGQRVYDQVNQ